MLEGRPGWKLAILPRVAVLRGSAINGRPRVLTACRERLSAIGGRTVEFDPQSGLRPTLSKATRSILTGIPSRRPRGKPKASTASCEPTNKLL